eukprot:508662-Pleurochrysis_carterae.AAC.1
MLGSVHAPARLCVLASRLSAAPFCLSPFISLHDALPITTSLATTMPPSCVSFKSRLLDMIASLPVSPALCAHYAPLLIDRRHLSLTTNLSHPLSLTTALTQRRVGAHTLPRRPRRTLLLPRRALPRRRQLHVLNCAGRKNRVVQSKRRCITAQPCVGYIHETAARLSVLPFRSATRGLCQPRRVAWTSMPTTMIKLGIHSRSKLVQAKRAMWHTFCKRVHVLLQGSWLGCGLLMAMTFALAKVSERMLTRIG